MYKKCCLLKNNKKVSDLFPSIGVSVYLYLHTYIYISIILYLHSLTHTNVKKMVSLMKNTYLPNENEKLLKSAFPRKRNQKKLWLVINRNVQQRKSV